MLTDVEIRKRTGNKKGLEDALRAMGHAPEELALVDDEFRTQWTQYVVEQKVMTLTEVFERAKAEAAQGERRS